MCPRPGSVYKMRRSAKYFLAEPGFDQGDPALRKSSKVMITFHAANDKSPCYIGVYQYKLY